MNLKHTSMSKNYNSYDERRGEISQIKMFNPNS